MSAARFLPYAASLLLDFAYAIIAVCALSRNTWASPLRTLACLLLCVLLVASTWWQSRLEAPSGAIQRSCVIAAAGSALCVIGSLVFSSWAVVSAGATLMAAGCVGAVHAWVRRDQPDSHVPGSPHRQH